MIAHQNIAVAGCVRRFGEAGVAAVATLRSTCPHRRRRVEGCWSSLIVSPLIGLSPERTDEGGRWALQLSTAAAGQHDDFVAVRLTR